MFVMHPRDAHDEVENLLRSGRSNRQIASLTGVPRSTVARWRTHGVPTRAAAPPPDPRWRPPDASSYAYLLGLYLGDGCISKLRAGAQLSICLDETYPGIVAEADAAIRTTIPGVHVGHYRPPCGGLVRLQAYCRIWLVAFPQHGPGKKHLRRIELVDWQRVITGAHPRELIRGFIHSDGCRTVNRFAVDLPRGGRRTYAYARYFFSNLSVDIRAIFTEHCDLLGIRWTLSNPRNVSVSHRRSVALLDEFVGAKA